MLMVSDEAKRSDDGPALLGLSGATLDRGLYLESAPHLT